MHKSQPVLPFLFMSETRACTIAEPSLCGEILPSQHLATPIHLLTTPIYVLTKGTATVADKSQQQLLEMLQGQSLQERSKCSPRPHILSQQAQHRTAGSVLSLTADWRPARSNWCRLEACTVKLVPHSKP